MFEIKELHASVEGKKILNGVNLKINPNEVHAIMGRNGTGKTSLSNVIMGHPKYTIESGDILWQGNSILSMSTNERAKARIFLAFQYPVAIPGVTVAQFLRSAILSVRAGEVAPKDVRKFIKQEMNALQIPDSFMTRSLNEGFSGGEKKRLEALQMRLLQPKFFVLDETDSGLDIDSLKQVSESISSHKNNFNSFLLITHYQRMLNYVKPDYVHVFHGGKIIKSGDYRLATELENKGYDWVIGEGIHA